MEKIHFLVKGSAEEPYKITFTKDGKDLSAFCTCPAGENGMYCKHRVNILKGESKNIVSDNAHQVAVVKEKWYPNSAIEAALKNVEKAESLLVDLKAAIALAKKEASIIMRKGYF
ncbi:SWIM zinc finger family protein [Xenorhabdus sp. XENO-1]|uniref:SWIM zinc finger family protein n=1 Tax=Xenorhabdus bovienii TaxID=40576 RepID=UPI0020CA9469|nr:SWIM zinc finger family protein [Xenorhabdus bovienii]MCP9269887.1 SWIM zinc finger family protein [Xenorhabdus bovienii subsp. africana]